MEKFRRIASKSCYRHLRPSNKKVISLQEEAVINALIRLGWTPPDPNNKDTCIAELEGAGFMLIEWAEDLITEGER